jgi:hypothetical protein
MEQKVIEDIIRSIMKGKYFTISHKSIKKLLTNLNKQP